MADDNFIFLPDVKAGVYVFVNFRDNSQNSHQENVTGMMIN